MWKYYKFSADHGLCKLWEECQENNFKQNILFTWRIFYLPGVLRKGSDLWIDVLALFGYVLKSKFKKWENDDDIHLFFNGPNFMRSGIIIPILLIMAFCFKSLTKRYIFHLTKCKHKSVSESIDFVDRNFFSVKPQQIFIIFFNGNILFPECSKKDQTNISDILMLFEYILRIKILKMWKWGRS